MKNLHEGTGLPGNSDSTGINHSQDGGQSAFGGSTEVEEDMNKKQKEKEEWLKKHRHFVEHGDSQVLNNEKQAIYNIEAQNKAYIPSLYESIKDTPYEKAESVYKTIRDTLAGEHKTLSEIIDRNNDEETMMAVKVLLFKVEIMQVGCEMAVLGKQMWAMEVDDSNPIKAPLLTKWNSLKREQSVLAGKAIAAGREQEEFLASRDPKITKVRAQISEFQQFI